MEKKKSVLDNIPHELLGYGLTASQKIWIYFIGATVFQCTIYMFDLASCIAVVNEHFKYGYIVWGTVSLLLMYFPSGIFYIITISKPDLWEEQGDPLKTAKWFVCRTAQFFTYPIWVIYRYAKQFFWALDALLQTDQEEKEEALLVASQPSQTELYLFLQTFMQAIPQAFLQLYIMLAHYQQDKTISEMQVLCITSSLLLIANKTVNFLWFESQKIAGRKEPWSPKVPLYSPDGETGDANEEIFKIGEEAESSTPFLQPRGLPSETPDEAINNSTHEEDNNNESTCLNSDHVIPIPRYSPPPRTISGSVKRNIYDLREDLAEGNVPQPASKNIELPKRKAKLVGRDNDDLIGLSVAFLWWLFFLFSRLLAFAACANFQPYVMLGVLVMHYIIIMILLLYRNGFPSIYKVFIQLCLGYVFTFCFIEFRYKLSKVNAFYLWYVILIVLENSIMSVSWYAYSDLDGFWYQFVFILIFASAALGLLSMALYFTILKPKKKLVPYEVPLSGTEV